MGRSYCSTRGGQAVEGTVEGMAKAAVLKAPQDIQMTEKQSQERKKAGEDLHILQRIFL
jgi:hypothetical protein